MLTIDVRTDINAALAMLTDLDRRLIPKATSAALNKVVVTARADAVRTIAATTGLKQKDIREHLIIRRASRNQLAAEIKAERFAPNLIRFNARQNKTGVAASPWKQRKTYRGAFIANAGRTVFARVGKARLPIKPLYGPSVPKELMRDYSTKAINATVASRFTLEFDRAFKQFMATRR